MSADPCAGSGTSLGLELQAFEAEHHRRAMLPDSLCHARYLVTAVSARLDRDVAEHVAQGDEVAFGIDDDLLDLTCASFEQPPQQVRLAGSAIALHEQPRCQQFL